MPADTVTAAPDAAAVQVQEVLRKKRQGQTLTTDEIQGFIAGAMAGDVKDYHVAAFLMAACIQGLTLDETVALTEAFVDSGDRLDTSRIDGIVVDKHSTGGVGDKTTLILVPLLAACGLKVAKLSGRGLGFTGGTIDKLEAIPEFNTALQMDAFIEQVNTVGAAISSQTANLAPADGKLYALRDVTATVDNIPMIAASVVSKKIATGADVVVLDIKVGQGAFMKTIEEAQELAQWCRQIGEQLGKIFSTVISRMEEPLGCAVGHTLEVLESIDVLKGQGPKDVCDLVDVLGGVALFTAGKADSLEAATALIKQKRQNGAGYDVFKAMVAAQGGVVAALEHTEAMPQPDRIRIFPAERSGVICEIDALKVAQATKMLGAGRKSKEDAIHLGVGVRLLHQVGDTVAAGDGIVEIHTTGEGENQAVEWLSDAITISDTCPDIQPVVVDIQLAK